MPAPSELKRILFVCTGNTCRSPMAEGLMQAALKKEHDFVRVASAGVAALPGQRASRETCEILKEKKAELKDFKSDQVDEAILAASSVIITMTDSHAQLVKQCFPDCASRVKLLSEFVSEHDVFYGRDLPDPIGMGASAYQEVAELIERAIPQIVIETSNL